MKILSFITLISFTSFVSMSALANETVKWTGVVQESNGYHVPSHSEGHSLVFVNKESGKSYDVDINPELLSVHTEKDKNLLIEVEGELTSRFLFWGGDLVIKNFKILEELDPVTHRDPIRNSRPASEYRGRASRL